MLETGCESIRMGDRLNITLTAESLYVLCEFMRFCLLVVLHSRTMMQKEHQNSIPCKMLHGIGTTTGVPRVVHFLHPSVKVRKKVLHRLVHDTYKSFFRFSFLSTSARSSGIRLWIIAIFAFDISFINSCTFL